MAAFAGLHITGVLPFEPDTSPGALWAIHSGTLHYRTRRLALLEA